MVEVLNVISEQLEKLNIPYEFGEWTEEISYPYFVGSFTETEHRQEDGYTGGIFTLDGWSRESKMSLMEVGDILKQEFDDFIVVQNGAAFFITFGNSRSVPTGEEDLYRITITLNTNEWKGA